MCVCSEGEVSDRERVREFDKGGKLGAYAIDAHLRLLWPVSFCLMYHDPITRNTGQV